MSVFPSSIRCEIHAVLLNNITIQYPGYTTLLPMPSLQSNSWRLFVSSFSANPQLSDPLYVINDIQRKLTSQISPEQITDKIIYPNDIIASDRLIPFSVIIPSGFVMPSKSNGNIFLIPPGNEPRPLVRRYTNESWFYHHASFKDMDKDGLIDIVTARANVLLPGGPASELIWIKNPGSDPTTTEPWDVYNMGADNTADLDVPFENIDSIEVLFVNGYFSRTLKMFWSELGDLWNDSSRLRSRDIDSERHRFFSVQLTMDLNGDGRRELLVTNNDANSGSLIAYELPPPGQLLTGEFKKHVLASGFKPTAAVQVGGAPGHADAVKPAFLKNRKKPIILLSGDDDGRAYILEAMNDDDPSDWQYTLSVLYDSKGSIIGQLSIEDIDGDGYPEVFVPAYDRDTVLIYRLMEKPTNAIILSVPSFWLTVSVIFILLLNSI